MIDKLKTKTDYDPALTEFAFLWHAPEGSPDLAQLEALAILIEHYENIHYPIPLPDPLDAIRFRMEQAGLTENDLVPWLGSDAFVSDLLAGKEELSIEIARLINRNIGVPFESMIHPQQDRTENAESKEEE